jgi:2-hydroxychromene-2-carboxylate isomerase
MSLKSLLMPAISQRVLSRQTLLKHRARHEKARKAQGMRHTVHYFHQVDDPYSALAAQCLQALQSRYDIDLTAHVVGPPPDSAAPERARLAAYSLKDARLAAAHWRLEFAHNPQQPQADALAIASAALVAACANGRFAELAAPLSLALWQGDTALTQLAALGKAVDMATPARVQKHMADADALRQRWGHYLGATFYYAGEWYWGVDRLHHLEARLQDLHALQSSTRQVQTPGLLFAPRLDLAHKSPPTPRAQAQAQGQVQKPAEIDFFVSLRSPYSAIVAPRVFELARHTGARVNLRYVLPMVMRGLPVPAPKRRYIALDAAREAYFRGTSFGRVNDPVGQPTERGLAVLALAVRLGLGEAFLLSFMQGVWAQGLDAGSDRALKTIAVRAGLSWPDAQAALQDDNWRKEAEHNRSDLFALGLWGVPSFRVRDVAVWGQDRLWAIEDELLRKDA